MPSIYHYPNFSIRLIPFIASYVEGEIVLAEHVHFRWLEKSMLLELDWAAADLPIVKDLVKSKYV
jgi:8-oxo-dGTP diphosphatase